MIGVTLIDHTGLGGKYDLLLHYALDYLPNHGGGPTMIEALQEQLSLRVGSKKTTVAVLVVDHAEKIPVGN